MSKDNQDNEKVGYGCPPKHSRFGEIGGNPINRNGRPKGSKNYSLSDEQIWRIFLKIGGEPVAIINKGETEYVTGIEALLRSQFQKALRGNVKAMELFIKEIQKAAKQDTENRHSLVLAVTKMIDRLEETAHSPNSFEHLEAKYVWFMYKKDCRKFGEELMYEDDEPIDRHDWNVFHYFFQNSQDKPFTKLPWPIPMPSIIREKYDRACLSKDEKEIVRTQNDLFCSLAELRELGVLQNYPYEEDEPRTPEELETYKKEVDLYFAGVKSTFINPFEYRRTPCVDEDILEEYNEKE